VSGDTVNNCRAVALYTAGKHHTLENMFFVVQTLSMTIIDPFNLGVLGQGK